VLLGPDSARYAEVHHLRPLGGHHRGLDRQDNMLVLCPNHHALFDLGTPFFLSLRRIRVGSTTFPLEVRHGLNRSNVDYHNALHKGAS
jgi:nitrite reductase/ring-hydroxylating ferredoxin subunit